MITSAFEAIVTVLGPTGTAIVGGIVALLIYDYVIESWRWRWRWHVRAWLGWYDNYD